MSRTIKFRYLSEYLALKKLVNSTEFKEYLAKHGINEKTQKPPTEKQIAQKVKFGLVSKFTSQIREVLAIGIKPSKALTYLNLAVKMYLKDAVGGEYPNLRIDYSQVLIANGPYKYLGERHRVVLSLSGLGCLSWLWRPVGYPEAEDLSLYLLIYNATAKTIVYKGVVGLITDAKAAFTITRFEKTDKLQAWVFGLGTKGRQVSESEYISNIGILD